jgi:hypothetical protein
MSYYSNVRNGTYTGEDSLVRECFVQAHRLRRSGQQMKAILAAGKEVKGTLNEDQYEDRLAENRNNPGELRTIVATQEHRRCEYFRARMLLQHHILPTVKDALERIIAAARQIGKRDDKVQWWVEHGLSHDEVSAVCETQAVVQGENIVELYARARDFVAEADETRGRGEKAFERAFRDSDSWHASFIPAEFQIVDGCDAHPLDLALQAAVDELLPKLIEFENDVWELIQFDPIRRTKTGSVTLQEYARWPELYSRVSRRMQHGYKDSIEGYDPGFGEVEGQPATDAAQALRAALATVTSQPQRWLAQSNLLGLTRRVTNRIRSLETDGFNLTIGAGSHFSYVYIEAVRRSFGSFITKVEEALPTL